ncbi:glucose-6-phosphate isomerase [Salinisphaera sp. USBA-960]|uniref:glucose-6-phosphate isomerase n=1 Tax=Salinisphaera orenii TaxID=856731 RepID=UPI000DBE5865|nr:glucose-6-phosphate isomerase [Salifodinibacter halophilus]NNC25981.1 glucose-6-phosphate isomerase [Salifodinibacter halophilus]
MAELDADWQWNVLHHLGESVGTASMVEAFATDASRARRMTLDAAGVTLDFSKQRLDDSALSALYSLAETQGFEAARRAMFAGDVVNQSEGRAAWHVALRRPADDPLYQPVHDERARIRDIADAVRSGDWQGYTGRAITDVVSIGIGGSDFGPRLVTEALAETRSSGPRAHFVANVDPADLNAALTGLDPATTLFVVISKTFTTAETLANAHAAKAWLLADGASESDVNRHFVAVSSNGEAVADFGIERMVGFWDWVGGRFSLWSSVGLPIALALGMETFDALLAGAHAMDNHFETADLGNNLPANLALISVWNRNILGLTSNVVVPYSQRLAHLPGFLQQLSMESNGKSVTVDGDPAAHATEPAIWGSVGTNAQHAYFQMLHQGDLLANVDFILPLATADSTDVERERQRLANCLAQAEALMCGRGPDETGSDDPAIAAARACPGNRPSNMLVLPRLDAYHLGALLAAYEHKVFVEGIVWGINSFDQWGVELGKTLAKQLVTDIADPANAAAHDGSTASLIQRAARAGG